MTLEAAEKRVIESALRATHGNQTRAAILIGTERHRLRRLIDRHDLQPLIHADSGK